MTKEEKALFHLLRLNVGSYIEDYLKDDCGHKSYEGTWELTVSYPSYFEDDTFNAPPESFIVQLHCYVLGPGRHYSWSGKNWMEALKKCQRDIKLWTRELS